MARMQRYIVDTPTSPYFAVKIAGHIFDSYHNFVVSMHFATELDEYGTMDFTMEDRFWQEKEAGVGPQASTSLEQALGVLIATAGEAKISFQFGWCDYHGSINASAWYEAYVSDYEPVFHPDHTLTITVTCIVTNKAPHDLIASYTSDNMSDIVRQVCSKEGWKPVEIMEAKKIEKPVTLTQANQESITFIRQQIEPKSVSAEDDSKPLEFYLSPDNEAYFVTPDKYANGGSMTEFHIYAGAYSNAISFVPQYSGRMISDSAQETAFISAETGEVEIYESKTNGKGGTEINVYNSTISDDFDQPMVNNKWFGRNVAAYPATLTVVGDYSLLPNDCIKVMPHFRDGTLHHSAGVYRITRINHEMETTFVTVLTLLRIQALEEGEPKMFCKTESRLEAWGQEI